MTGTTNTNTDDSVLFRTHSARRAALLLIKLFRHRLLWCTIGWVYGPVYYAIISQGLFVYTKRMYSYHAFKSFQKMINPTLKPSSVI